MRTYLACWLVCSVLLPSAASAQDDWINVQAIRKGTHLRVDTVPAEYEGKLISVGDTQITVDKYRVERPEVQRIQSIGNQAGRGLAWGTLAGFALGTVQSYALAEGNKLAFGLYLGSRWAVLGALVGASVGAKTERRTLLYQKP